jgi:hypothetical protein
MEAMRKIDKRAMPINRSRFHLQIIGFSKYGSNEKDRQEILKRYRDDDMTGFIEFRIQYKVISSRRNYCFRTKCLEDWLPDCFRRDNSSSMQHILYS